MQKRINEHNAIFWRNYLNPFLLKPLFKPASVFEAVQVL